MPNGNGNGNWIAKSITIAVTATVLAAMILATVTTLGTVRVHGAVLTNHTNRHSWAVSAIRRNEERIGEAEGDLKAGMAALEHIKEQLNRIEEKLEK